MKILIIMVRYNLSTSKANYIYILPIGLGYISSVLKNIGYEVKILNLNAYDGNINDPIRKTLMKENYDFILMGGLSVHYPAFEACVDAIRSCAPSAQIILGGGLISSQPELMFEALKPNYIVIGEGEITIQELLRCLEKNGDLNEVNGIGYRSPDGKLVLTSAREAIKDLDALPWPDYAGLGFEDYLDHMRPSHGYLYDLFDAPRAYPLISSRSCPFLCTFCFHPLGNQYRQRSIGNIMNELEFAVKRYRINIIDIYDELFSNNKKRVYEFCEQIKRLSKDVGWEIKWNAQTRVDQIDEELLLTMKDAGCYVLSLGLESYSED
ncbi:MAG: radical SAM protein, partial [Candidatus Poribacteria bacterium]